MIDIYTNTNIVVVNDLTSAQLATKFPDYPNKIAPLQVPKTLTKRYIWSCVYVSAIENAALDLKVDLVASNNNSEVFRDTILKLSIAESGTSGDVGGYFSGMSPYDANGPAIVTLTQDSIAWTIKASTIELMVTRQERHFTADKVYLSFMSSTPDSMLYSAFLKVASMHHQ